MDALTTDPLLEQGQRLGEGLLWGVVPLTQEGGMLWVVDDEMHLATGSGIGGPKWGTWLKGDPRRRPFCVVLSLPAGSHRSTCWCHGELQSPQESAARRARLGVGRGDPSRQKEGPVGEQTTLSQGQTSGKCVKHHEQRRRGKIGGQIMESL